MEGPEEADVADDHAVVEASGTPSGPRQVGRGVKGQNVYWITMSHPSDEVVQRLGLKVPSEFRGEEFSEGVPADAEDSPPTSSRQAPSSRGRIIAPLPDNYPTTTRQLPNKFTDVSTILCILPGGFWVLVRFRKRILFI